MPDAFLRDLGFVEFACTAGNAELGQLSAAGSRRSGAVRRSRQDRAAELSSFLITHIGLDPIRAPWNSVYHHAYQTKITHG
jgi:hypothetical protein